MAKRPTFWRRVWDRLSSDDTIAPRRRVYDGARTGRRTDGWKANGSSADTEIGESLVKMRDRARELVRNNPLARRIIDVMTALIVGDGIVGSSNTGDAALDEKVQKLWERWQTECDSERDLDFAGLQQLAIRSMLESGESLCRFRPRRADDGLTVPLQLQITEADLIDDSRNGVIDGKNVRLGIRYDAFDRREAYYLLKAHPGDMLTVNTSLAPSIVPASELLHLFVKTRPGQSRGVTWLAPVMVALRDLGDMQDAMLFREKLNACMTYFIKREAGYEGEDDQQYDSDGRAIETIEPGVATNLRPGEEPVKAETPGADSTYSDFVRLSENLIAIGAGVTYDQLTGDMTQANYSSLKAADRIQRRCVIALQWNLAIPRFCQPVWDRFIQEALAMRLIEPREGGYPVRWLPPAQEYIDKMNDLEADILEMSAGGKTWSQFVQERGWDPAKQVADIAADKELLAKAGIDLGEVLAHLAARPKAQEAPPAKPQLKLAN